MTRPLFVGSDYPKSVHGIRDAVIEVIAASDRRWGIDRLRLLVDDELRTRWDNQLRHLEQALRSGAALEVRKHAAATQRGLQALEAAARAAGHQELHPEVWETMCPDGTLVAIVRMQVENLAVCDRYDEVYTLAEVGLALSRFGSDVGAMKRNFPGAEIARACAAAPSPTGPCSSDRP